MIIKTIGEYKSFIRELSTEIRARDAYKHTFEIWLEDNLYQGIILNLSILDDGQRLHAIKDVNKKDFIGMKDTMMETYDVRLLEDGGLEMVKTGAVLSEREDFNKRRLNKAPEDASSVLMTHVTRKRFDADDVEISRTEYFDSDCPLYGVHYEDKQALLRLLDSPEHKPVITDEKVELPTVTHDASSIHTVRVEDDPAIAITTSRYKRDYYNQDITTVVAGMVSPDWPENLRVQDEHKLAIRKDGKWETIKGSLYSGATFEENIERATKEWKEKIEYSMTKKYNFPQYGVLKERINKVNKEKTLEKIR